MASSAKSELSREEHSELCCVYASLLLYDERMNITSERMNKLVTSSGNKLDQSWTASFAHALKGINMEALLSSIGSAPSASAAPQLATESKPAQLEEKPVEEEEEDAMDGAMGLFGDEDY